MRFHIFLIGCLAIPLLQAKPLDLLSRILKTATGKRLGDAQTDTIVDIPDVRNIILHNRLNSSVIESLDLSKFGVDEIMQKWLKRALKGLMEKHNKNKLSQEKKI